MLTDEFKAEFIELLGKISFEQVLLLKERMKVLVDIGDDPKAREEWCAESLRLAAEIGR